jgi:maleylacetate reductase
VIVRWGLWALQEVLAELDVSRPLLVRSNRWADADLGVEVEAVWDEVPTARIGEVAAAAPSADGVLALGGGSAIDLGKAVSAETGLPLVSVPTTYSGAEWTIFFGVRSPDRIMRGGGGGANTAGIVYEPKLTLGLPAETTVGTSMNALDHCAEALYSRNADAESDEHALRGAASIAEWLPQVVERPDDVNARTHLLEGAADAGAALRVGMGVAHAMAQTVGGAYGHPHGTLNGICLPAALRFNRPYAPEAIARFAKAIGGGEDPARRVEELAALAGPTRLRDLGVPEGDLPRLAESAAGRPGNRTNPRPATAAEIEAMLRSVW